MGRRRSTFDDLILLPWPACLAIGMAGYFALRYGVGWYFSSREGTFAQALGNAAMQLRINRRSREQFWGCSGYPSCRATLAAEATGQ